MVIEAPLSKYRKNNIKIYIVICVVLAAWFFYDGYFNRGFMEKHTDANKNPNSTLMFNRKSPPYLLGAAVVLGVYLFGIRNKKVVLDGNNLTAGKLNITCDSIEKIDKTNFSSKGYFVITYKDPKSNEYELKLSDRTYDNLPAILDELVARIG